MLSTLPASFASELFTSYMPDTEDTSATYTAANNDNHVLCLREREIQ